MSQAFVEPAYEDRSLGDVLPAVSRALGVDVGLPPSGIELPAASRYVLLLVDGLGLELLTAHPDEAPFLHSLVGAPAGGTANGTAGMSTGVTAGVPSTTATSLTSLGTALRPGSHGVVGFTSRIPGTLDLLNALTWNKRVDPVVWQPHPTAFERLARAGVHTTVVNKREFAGTGLTVAGQRGAQFVGADKVGERVAAVVASTRDAPSLTYTYDGDLDWTGHRHGVDSLSWRLQLSMVDAAAEQLRENLPDDVRLLVTADHGMVDSSPGSRLDVDDHPELLDGVAVLGGEARFRHVYCSSGARDDLAAAWRETVGDRAVVLTREEASARGWFGPVEDRVLPRIGDLLVACRDDFSVMSTAAFPYETRLVGLHGSLTTAEMSIPVLVA